MDIHTFTRELHVKNDSKIVMLVADGLGGLPMTPGGKTELESANMLNAAPLFWAWTMSKKPGITVCVSNTDMRFSIIHLVNRSRANTTAANP